jgi:hypothetical protein
VARSATPTFDEERVFGRVDARSRAPLNRWLKHIAQEGVTNIPLVRLRFEQRLRIPGTSVDVPVWALREFQTRLYGGPVQGMQPPTYLFTEIDDAKKQDKADRSKLQRAAELLYEHFIKG